MAHAEHYVVHARSQPDAAPARPRDGGGAPAAAKSGLHITISGDLRDVASEWRRFEQDADYTVFQSYDWLSTWQACVGARTKATPAIVLGRAPSGALLFILPLAIETGGFVRRLTFLGHELCDYNGPLLAPDFSRLVGPEDFGAVWQDIRTLLQSQPPYRHDLILLDKMPERIGAQPNPFLKLAVTPNPSGAYLTGLTADWEQFYTAKRSSATRRRDRTKRKRLAESGEIRMVTPTKPADVATTLDALIAQKRRAFTRMGVADIFARPGYCEFFARLAARTRGLVHISRLDVGPVPAATNLGLTFRGCYYHILASYDDGPLARFGPGAAHLHELMRYAIAHGCTRFDFTIGDEPYKRDWCDTELALYDHVGAASARGWLAATVTSALRRGKRLVKHSSLWPALTRIRARLAGLRTSKGPPTSAVE